MILNYKAIISFMILWSMILDHMYPFSSRALNLELSIDSVMFRLSVALLEENGVE